MSSSDIAAPLLIQIQNEEDLSLANSPADEYNRALMDLFECMLQKLFELSNVKTYHKYNFYRTSKFRNQMENTSLQFLQEITINPVGRKIYKYPIRISSREHSKVLILDLDDTIIKNVTFEEKENLCKFKKIVELKSGTKIILRPFLNQFLSLVSSKFDIVLFTSSEQHYADEILNYIDPSNRLFKKRLYRQHCIINNKALIKNIDCFYEISKKSIIALDDKVSFYINNIDNVLPAIPFSGLPGDVFLLYALEYLIDLSSHYNFIEFNRKYLNLKKYFQNFP